MIDRTVPIAYDTSVHCSVRQNHRLQKDNLAVVPELQRRHGCQRPSHLSNFSTRRNRNTEHWKAVKTFYILREVISSTVKAYLSGWLFNSANLRILTIGHYAVPVDTRQRTAFSTHQYCIQQKFTTNTNELRTILRKRQPPNKNLVRVADIEDKKYSNWSCTISSNVHIIKYTSQGRVN